MNGWNPSGEVIVQEEERGRFAAWLRANGVAWSAAALGECSSTVLHVAVGASKPSTARRVRDAWRALLEANGERDD
jgi:hypothetical protein